MRERLNQIGGWLDVDFDVGRSTVTAFVPRADDSAQISVQEPHRH
jgi:hypothetical protein